MGIHTADGRGNRRREGKTLWVYDPETWKNGTRSNNGFVDRGVTYWAERKDRRILFGTGDGYLICLNAATGKPIPTFGRSGQSSWLC